MKLYRLGGHGFEYNSHPFFYKEAHYSTILTVTVQGNGIAQRERLHFLSTYSGFKSPDLAQRETIDMPKVCYLGP